MPPTEIALPRGRFLALWARLGAEGGGEAAFERVRGAYAEPHRAYHNAGHIAACLELLDDAAVRALAERADEVEAALWFHDAVYDPRRSDNEEESARLVETLMRAAGIQEPTVARVAGMVRATEAHAMRSGDAALAIDIDLSILGGTPEAFDRFEAQIRHEYGWVEDEAYRAGRTAVLHRLGARASIYATPLLAARFEAAARANLAKALARLATR